MALISTFDSLEIRKLPGGGYLVADAYRGNGEYCSIRFGCTTLGEALEFIKTELGRDPMLGVVSAPGESGK